MNTTQHTPTPLPWATGEHYDQIVQAESGARVADIHAAFGAGGKARVAANAQFIVTACNAHAANVARIAELEGMLRHVIDMMETDTCDEYVVMVADCRAALKGE